nr:hypothetical protein Iba_chr13bCG13200 [Ipomoea batatas]
MVDRQPRAVTTAATVFFLPTRRQWRRVAASSNWAAASAGWCDKASKPVASSGSSFPARQRWWMATTVSPSLVRRPSSVRWQAAQCFPCFRRGSSSRRRDVAAD